MPPFINEPLGPSGSIESQLDSSSQERQPVVTGPLKQVPKPVDIEPSFPEGPLAPPFSIVFACRDAKDMTASEAIEVTILVLFRDNFFMGNKMVSNLSDKNECIEKNLLIRSFDRSFERWNRWELCRDGWKCWEST